MNRLAFWIPGRPVPKARAKVVIRRGQPIRAVTPERTREYERKVGLCARAAGARPARGRVAVSLRIVMCDGPGQDDWDPDNVLKSVLDGLTHVAWIDDRQVREVHITCHDPDDPKDQGASVLVEPLT